MCTNTTEVVGATVMPDFVFIVFHFHDNYVDAEVVFALESDAEEFFARMVVQQREDMRKWSGEYMLSEEYVEDGRMSTIHEIQRFRKRTEISYPDKGSRWVICRRKVRRPPAKLV